MGSQRAAEADRVHSSSRGVATLIRLLVRLYWSPGQKAQRVGTIGTSTRVEMIEVVDAGKKKYGRVGRSPT